MKWFRHSSIRTKLILIILTVSFVIVALVGGARIVWDMQQARQALVQEISTLTSLLGDRSSAALAFDDSRLARENLNSLQTIPHVLQACLYRNNSTLLASYQRADARDTHCPRVNQTEAMQQHFDEYSLHVTTAIHQDSLSLGWIYLRSDLSPIEARLHNQLIFSGLALLAAILITGLLAGWLQRLISGPIEAITRVARAIEEQGDHSLRTNLSGDDEVGRLARTFNAMLDALEVQSQQLVTAKDKQIIASSHYRSLVESTLAIPWELEIASWRFTYVGLQAEKLFGYPLENWYQKNFWPDHLHPDDRDASIAYCKHAASKAIDGQFEYRMLAADGRSIWIHEDVQVISKNGTAVRMQGFMFDITERRQTEESLRRSQKMEAIGQLSGGIAHDFNNQLGVIVGYLDYLKNYTADDKEPGNWVDTATRATLRCMDLTRQLLAFSRRQSSVTTVVDLNAALRELETMIARSLTPEVEVDYILADDLWLTEINSGEFQDAILNLVINARDAMPNGGKLVIETSNRSITKDDASFNSEVDPGNYVQLTLSDTGMGMDKETREHIFEPFFTTKPEGKGTGLGMAMVYGFVKRYGGHINIYSEPDIGTSIRMKLPCTAAIPAAEINPVEENKLPTGNETILVVDDELDLLQLAEQYLRDLGYHVLSASNAAQALALLVKEDSIKLLFSDVIMPGGVNGYDLAQQATQLRPELKILLTSGFTSKTMTHNGLSHFTTQLLNKPYRKDELAQRIRRVLDQTSNDIHKQTETSIEKQIPASRTILIVDDEADIRDLFKLNLERLGYKTMQASNAEEAISLYQQALKNNKPIHALILDLGLPGSMGGKEVAEKIRTLDSQAKIIVSSGNTTGEEMMHYHEHGFDAALEKNFNRETIRQVLEQLFSDD